MTQVQIVVDKSMLEYYDDGQGMAYPHPTMDLHTKITNVTDQIDKADGGDSYDGLQVEGGLRDAMWDVWNGVRQSFTLTLIEPTPGSVTLT